MIPSGIIFIRIQRLIDDNYIIIYPSKKSGYYDIYYFNHKYFDKNRLNEMTIRTFYTECTDYVECIDIFQEEILKSNEET